MAVQAEHDFWGTLSVVLLSLVGVGGLALIVSKNANTTSVVQATGSAFSNSLAVALSPVTGSAYGSSYGASATFPIA